MAVGVHGYHLGVDDSGVYLPAVLKVIHPGLYPYGAEFFLAHARLSLFAAVVGASARITPINDDPIFFLWHLATIFFFLLAVWQLAKALFTANRARWSALLVSAATLTVPVAGTALVIMDPYLTARSASTPFTVFAVAAWLHGRRSRASIWIVLAFLVHPLMAAYGLLCLGFLAIPATWTARFFRDAPLFRLFRNSLDKRAIQGFAFLAAPFRFAPVSPAYRQAIAMRNFLFLSRWTWWEWIGLAAPVAILVWLGKLKPRGLSPVFGRTSRALALFGIFATVLGMLLSFGPAAETFAWLQPMRAFQLIYIVLFLLLGGLLGEYVLKSRSWAWIAFFFLLAAGIFSIQRETFAQSRHIEWPWAAPKNSWVAAFQWIRDNTPQNAVFALDPGYIALPGEDQHGFRALARRSVLSDYYKDSGVVSVFPNLAGEWQREQQAQQGWKSFTLTDFQRLARDYPVSWVVLQGAVPEGLDCPYKNQAVAVCHIPGAPGL